MKFYIKLESGAYIEIADEKSAPEGVVLYIKTADGAFMAHDPAVKIEPAVTATPTVVIPDYIKELTGLIKDLTVSVTKVKEKEEETNAKLAAYQEMTKRGLPIPSSIIPDNSPAGEGVEKGVLADMNMAVQGKELMDKRFYPNYRIEDDTKKAEIAKFMCLFLKGGIMKDPKSIMEFWEVYGKRLRSERKTEIGDSGNLFPVTDMIESEVLAFARESSIALQYARVVDMTMEKQTWPGEDSSVTVAWGNTTNQSDPTVSDVEVSAEELSAFSSVKNTSLDDSATDIVSWLFSNMSEAVGLELDNVMWNGDGSSTYGSVSGIFLTAGYSVALASGSTAFSQVNSIKLSEMIAKLDGLKKQGARFFMHGTTLHYIRSLVDSNNRPIFIETVGSAIAPTIWGMPYTESTKCPSTSAANTMFIAFGNLRHWLVGRRRGVMGLDANPYENWTTNRTAFKIYSRWGLGTGRANGLVRLRTASE